MKIDESIALSNIDLDNIGHDLNLQFTVMSEDKIMSSIYGTYIVNYTDADSGGTHWYVACIDAEYYDVPTIVVFDPLGAPVDDVLVAYAKKHKYTIVTSTERAQSDSSNMCGLWCIWFINNDCDIDWADRELRRCKSFAQKEMLMLKTMQ